MNYSMDNIQDYALSQYMTSEFFSLIRVERGSQRAIEHSQKFLHDFQIQYHKLADKAMKYSLADYMSSDKYYLILSERGKEQAIASIERNISKNIHHENHLQETFSSLEERYNYAFLLAENTYRKSKLHRMVTFEKGQEQAEKRVLFFIKQFGEAYNLSIAHEYLTMLSEKYPDIHDKIIHYPISFWKTKSGINLLQNEKEPTEQLNQFIHDNHIAFEQTQPTKNLGLFKGFFNRLKKDNHFSDKKHKS